MMGCMFCGFRDETLLAHNRWDYFFPRFLMLFIHARTSLTDTFILSFCLFISPSSTLWVSMPAPQCKYAPFLYSYNQSQAREKQKTLVHWENNLLNVFCYEISFAWCTAGPAMNVYTETGCKWSRNENMTSHKMQTWTTVRLLSYIYTADVQLAFGKDVH